LAVRIGLFVGVITHAAARHAHRIPHPTLVTTAKRPSDRGGTGGKMGLICPTRQAENFSEHIWTEVIDLKEL
jgi:hypothetical protein